MAVEVPKALRRASSNSSCASSHAKAERNARVAAELSQISKAFYRACSRPSCTNSKFSCKCRKELQLACKDHQVAAELSQSSKALCRACSRPSCINSKFSCKCRKEVQLACSDHPSGRSCYVHCRAHAGPNLMQHTSLASIHHAGHASPLVQITARPV